MLLQEWCACNISSACEVWHILPHNASLSLHLSTTAYSYDWMLLEVTIKRRHGALSLRSVCSPRLVFEKMSDIQSVACHWSTREGYRRDRNWEIMNLFLCNNDVKAVYIEHIKIWYRMRRPIMNSPAAITRQIPHRKKGLTFCELHDPHPVHFIILR